MIITHKCSLWIALETENYTKCLYMHAYVCVKPLSHKGSPFTAHTMG